MSKSLPAPSPPKCRSLNFLPSFLSSPVSLHPCIPHFLLSFSISSFVLVILPSSSFLHPDNPFPLPPSFSLTTASSLYPSSCVPRTCTRVSFARLAAVVSPFPRHCGLNTRFHTQDAKKDEACRKAYKYLASLHEVGGPPYALMNTSVNHFTPLPYCSVSMSSLRSFSVLFRTARS